MVVVFMFFMVGVVEVGRGSNPARVALGGEDPKFILGGFDVFDCPSVAVFASSIDLDYPSAPLLYGFHFSVVSFREDALGKVAGLSCGQFVVVGCHWFVGLAYPRNMSAMPTNGKDYFRHCRFIFA